MGEDPKEFVNKFRTRLRTIARAYPQDQIPKEEMWKRVMMENVPESIKSRLKIYATDGRGEAFLMELEKERSSRRNAVI